jgi:hypothetical protein
MGPETESDQANKLEAKSSFVLKKIRIMTASENRPFWMCSPTIQLLLISFHSPSAPKKGVTTKLAERPCLLLRHNICCAQAQVSSGSMLRIAKYNRMGSYAFNQLGVTIKGLCEAKPQ